MGKRSFILGALAATAAIAEAAASESTTYRTAPTKEYYVRSSVPTPSRTTYVQSGTQTHSYTSPNRYSGGTMSIARNAYRKLVDLYDILDDGDVVEMSMDIGLELSSIWRTGRSIRITTLSTLEKEAIENVITAFGLPITGRPSKLASEFAKVVRYI